MGWNETAIANLEGLRERLDNDTCSNEAIECDASGNAVFGRGRGFEV